MTRGYVFLNILPSTRVPSAKIPVCPVFCAECVALPFAERKKSRIFAGRKEGGDAVLLCKLANSHIYK